MIHSIDDLCNKYRDKGIIIDSNLLLLFFVGRCDPKQISVFKRTQTFTPEDFELIERFILFFKTVRTTPNILTEVSNHLNQLKDHLKADFYEAFADCIQDFLEEYKPSAILSREEHFIKFGLTDSSIVEDAKNKYLVLTDDFKLSNYLQSKGVDAINFNHIRKLNLNW